MLLQLFIFFLTLGIQEASGPPAPRVAPVSIVLEIEKPPAAKAELDEMVKQTVQVLLRRLDDADNSLGVIERSDGARIELGFRYPVDKLDGLSSLLTRPGVLSFNLVDEAADPGNYPIGVPKSGRLALPDDGRNGEPTVIFLDTIVTGPDFADASQIIDEFDRPAIAFHFRPSATKKFGDATTHNVGRRFAIVLDDHIVSAPNIETPITTGVGRISGSFTVEEAKQLASMLNSGALPARLVIVEQKVNLPR